MTPVSKESVCNAWDLGSILGLRRSPGERNGTHSNILAWEIPWTEKPGELQSMWLQESDITQWLNHHHHHTVLYSGDINSHSYQQCRKVPVRRVQRKRQQAGQSGKKREIYYREKRGWLALKENKCLPFLTEYTPPMKNYLKDWSPGQRSGIWWSRSFDRHQWDNRMPFGQFGQSQGPLWF